MTIDKTTFMGYLQIVSAVCAVLGSNVLDDPKNQMLIWQAWAIVVSVLGGLKGKWTKTDDGLVEPSRPNVVEQAELNLIAAQINTEKAKKKAYESKVV